MYISMYICAYICLYVCVYVHTYKCMYICINIYVHISMNAYMHICIHTHTHTYVCTYIHTYMWEMLSSFHSKLSSIWLANELSAPLYNPKNHQIKSNQIKFYLKSAMYIWKKRKISKKLPFNYTQSGHILLYKYNYTSLQKYAEEYNISFNGSKSRLLLFKGRQYKVSNRGIIVNGVLLNMPESAVHLGHHACTNHFNDKDCIITVAKTAFLKVI